MINVSNEFQKLMGIRTDFKENAEITFSDGTVLELTEKDFTVSNNSVVDSSDINGIPLGVAVCRSVQIELMNDDDRFSSYDFFGAVIRLYLTFQLSETVEKIEYGTFTVLTPETYGTTVIVTALDDMYKADKTYSTSLSFPATIKEMLIDACDNLGIPLGTTSFKNDNFTVQSKPTDLTYRQIIGYIAMIAGGNARIDVTGRLRIISYDFEKLSEVSNIIDGGIYAPWNNPTELDGGAFNPWDEGDNVDGGLFTDRKEYHTLYNWSNIKVDTDDVVITGVQTTYTDSENKEHTVIYGEEGYVLLFENPLILGQEQSVVGLIGNVMVGGRFRQFSGDLVANPTIEFMDVALILDRKGNMYSSFITDINFQFFGFTTLKNSAEPTLRNSAKSYSEATKTLVKAKELIKAERTARETAISQLAKELSNSSGLFMTEEKQEDGSVIYYMHDKPTLKESMIVWKLTALAFGISTDGGKTYPYGFTVNGETITRLLYAEGINADYITSGTIQSKDGSASIDLDSGVISIKSNHFSWQSTYSSLTSDGKLTAKDVDLTGKIKANSGTIGGFNLTDSSLYSGSKTSLTSILSGVYVGTDGISVGNSLGGIKITSYGDVSIKGTGSIELEYRYDGAVLKMSLDSTGISFGTSTSFNTNITSNKIQIDNVLMDRNSIKISGTSSYIEAKYNNIRIYNSYSDYWDLDVNSFTFNTSGGFKFNDGTYNVMSLLKSRGIYGGELATLGKLSGKISFFGSATGNTKTTVSNITSPSSASASTIATKLNELLTALRGYNLIG